MAESILDLKTEVVIYGKELQLPGNFSIDIKDGYLWKQKQLIPYPAGSESLVQKAARQRYAYESVKQINVNHLEKEEDTLQIRRS